MNRNVLLLNSDGTGIQTLGTMSTQNKDSDFTTYLDDYTTTPRPTVKELDGVTLDVCLLFEAHICNNFILSFKKQIKNNKYIAICCCLSFS